MQTKKQDKATLASQAHAGSCLRESTQKQAGIAGIAHLVLPADPNDRFGRLGRPTNGSNLRMN